MRISDYLRSRMSFYAIELGGLALAVLFLIVFRTPVYGIVIVVALLLIGTVAAELYEINRRKPFYDHLEVRLEDLDRAYLLAEMIDEPSFYDGQVLCDALQVASRSMNDLVAQRTRESQEFREFIELWVHEIKLPVAGLQLMCHNDGNERYATQLARIDDMVQNVLYYARSESAEKDYVIREVSIARAFANVALKMRDELLARDVQIETGGLDTTVMTDGKWLEYMLGQLMANSVKYASPERDTLVRVSVEEHDDRTTMRFWDNGIGIPASDLPHIFEKSFTGSNGRIGENSTGIGLYIISGLCERLGHQLSADSVEGEWTQISISFGKNGFFELD